MGIDGDLVLRVDGSRALTIADAEAVQALCDRAEDQLGPAIVTVHVSGTPSGDWTGGFSVGLVSKWERALRRLERLGAFTVTAASGDCGGTALDVLLATDHRIAAPGTRLIVAAAGDATWPGMALHRLAQQTGPAAVRGAALLGTPIEAAAALALHLVDQVTDDLTGALAALTDAADPFAGRELAIRRRLLFDAATTPFEDALGAHLAAVDRTISRGPGS